MCLFVRWRGRGLLIVFLLPKQLIATPDDRLDVYVALKYVGDFRFEFALTESTMRVRDGGFC